MKDRQFQSNHDTDLTIGSYQLDEVHKFTAKTYQQVGKEENHVRLPSELLG